ncbi:MAG: M1 family metallopeptidase [Caulobacterales bacterium]|nr:M1 family metallopeptidase [Caulobacterales bacterium]
MNFRLSAAASAAVIVISAAACSREDASTPTLASSPEIAATAAVTNAPADQTSATQQELRRDKFSYANYDEVRVTHVSLDLDVLFDEKVLDGTATLDLEYVKPDAKSLILDTNDLTIRSVDARVGEEWVAATINLGADDPVMGSRLEIALPEGAAQVRIAYRTSPGALGLQWLAPEQTAGKAHPFMYSQNQAINARSMVPIQDTPAIRITYDATLRTQKDLFAVMSAAQDPDGVRDGDYYFSMPQPIPPYLIAVAVGDIEFRPISDHIGVYAEDYIVDRAAKEFEDTPKMEAADAALYGPYRWDRYDMLVLPPSFPIGGMENPRLTFLTPTIIAGDKSLTNVVAHELAHSWSGNLVTNATWRDAWLNEGVTSYVENRVMEALYGPERAEMERTLDLDELKRVVGEAKRPELTQLKMPADIEDPDDAFSQVSYIKGAFFLKFLETRFGRDVFDPFLKGYFDHFAFKTVITEDFVEYLKDNLLTAHPGVVSEEEVHEWLYEPGLSATMIIPHSDAFAKIVEMQAAWLAGDMTPADFGADGWTTHEWLSFINSLPDHTTLDQFAALDITFDLTHSTNDEIAFAWFMKSIDAGYEPAFPEIRKFLLRVGRGKFIFRLYSELVNEGRKVWAQEVYAEARPGYHPVTQQRLDETLK